MRETQQRFLYRMPTDGIRSIGGQDAISVWTRDVLSSSELWEVELDGSQNNGFLRNDEGD